MRLNEEKGKKKKKRGSLSTLHYVGKKKAGGELRPPNLERTASRAPLLEKDAAMSHQNNNYHNSLEERKKEKEVDDSGLFPDRPTPKSPRLRRFPQKEGGEGGKKKANTNDGKAARSKAGSRKKHAVSN